MTEPENRKQGVGYWCAAARLLRAMLIIALCAAPVAVYITNMPGSIAAPLAALAAWAMYLGIAVALRSKPIGGLLIGLMLAAVLNGGPRVGRQIDWVKSLAAHLAMCGSIGLVAGFIADSSPRSRDKRRRQWRKAQASREVTQ